MILHVFYLRFPSEATAREVLATLVERKPHAKEDMVSYPLAGPHWSLDPVGVITVPGVYDAETDEELEPPDVLEGWHANYVGAHLPPELEVYQLVPAPLTPYRRFAGF